MKLVTLVILARAFQFNDDFVRDPDNDPVPDHNPDQGSYPDPHPNFDSYHDQ